MWKKVTQTNKSILLLFNVKQRTVTLLASAYIYLQNCYAGNPTETISFTLSKPLPVWISKRLVAPGWHIRTWRSIHTTMVVGAHSIKPGTGRHPWPHWGWSIAARLLYKFSMSCWNLFVGLTEVHCTISMSKWCVGHYELNISNMLTVSFSAFNWRKNSCLNTNHFWLDFCARMCFCLLVKPLRDKPMVSSLEKTAYISLI